MGTITKYTQGEFCWTDLGTPDVAASKKFYSSIFGWKSVDRPMGMGDAMYSLLTMNGKDACALYPMMDEQKEAGVPPNWLAYIAVDNVKEMTKKANSAGAKTLMEPMDVNDVGSMCILQDPAGAVFALWQAKKHIGATINEDPGTVCWRELVTPNVDLSGKFYTSVFGWTIKPEKFGDITYHILQKDGWDPLESTCRHASLSIL